MALGIVVVLMGALAAFLGGPLRKGRLDAADEREQRDREALEVAKEAKYREILELEMDYRTGKVDEPEYRVQDRALRAEAVGLLRALDRYA